MGDRRGRRGFVLDNGPVRRGYRPPPTGGRPGFDDEADDGYGYGYDPTPLSRGGGGGEFVSEALRTRIWIGGGMLLLVLALTIATLGLAIWAVVQSSNNRHRIDEVADSTSGGMAKRSEPQDRQQGRVAELEDVRLGTKQRPLEDGDLLKWENGRVVNARDRALEQELGHHLDTHFERLRNGDIIIRNETSGQWRNAPLSIMLALGSLSDVDMRPGQRGGAHRGSTRKRTNARETGLVDRSLLEYDQQRAKWVTRTPRARAWLRFCVPPESDPETSWGRVSGLVAQRWSSVRPVSPQIGIYALDPFSRGGMMVSRKHVSIRTPKADRDSRPSVGGAAGGRSYRIRASVSAANLPEGAWGFLVGSEPSPKDGGFQVSASTLVTQRTIESLRTIAPDQEIVLAFRASSALDQPRLLVQCLHMSVEEL